MANRKETLRITKILNSIYNNAKFLSELCNLCDNNYNGVLFALGDILEYYITSRDNRILTVEEMNVIVGLFKYIGKNKDYKVFNIKLNESPEHVIRRNVLKDGYMTRAINTYFLKRIKKYGLGDKRNIDKKLNKEFNELESIFGKSEFSMEDKLDNNQFCMSTPGTNSFYNAGTSAPRRFFMGILGQTQNDMIPLVVGESKIDYFKRVLEKKVSILEINKKIKKKALKTGIKVIKKLCKHKPAVLLIPINNDNYSIKVTKERNSNYDLMPINDWIYLKLMNQSAMKFFARDFGENNEDLGNIIAYDSIIPSKEMGIVEVPDRYDIMQIIAKNRGYKKNTEFDYLTGKKLEEEIKNNQ